jgi:predicted amidohydrolase YtcJ
MSSARGSVVSPDTVLHNGNILSIDRDFSMFQALAVRGERILATGSNADILSLAGSRTRRIDLAGRTVVPGFIDTHAHMDREGLRRAYPSLQGCRSMAEVQAVVRQAAAGRTPGEWVVIMPLGEPPFHLEPEQTLAERRYPDRYDLDQAAPDHPVWVRAIWPLWNNAPPFVHVLNSAGLRALGIDRHTTPTTALVEIERDEAGEPTGRILDRCKNRPLSEYTLLKDAPRFTHEVRVRALKEAMRLSAAAGTTSTYEGHGVAAELHNVYKDLHDRGEQVVRTYIPISPPPWSSFEEATRQIADWAHYASGPGFGDQWFKVGGLHLTYGGDPEVAAIDHAIWPYRGWSSFTDQHNPPDEYRELCRVAARHRLRVGTIPSRIDEVLTIWEEINREHRIDDLRWVLVHGSNMLPERDFPRIKRLGLVVTTQPASYIYRSGRKLSASGTDYNRYQAHRDYIEAGIPWSLSTDNKPYWMLFGLWVAVARRERVEHEVLGPAQRVTVAQALRAMTYMGAYVTFEEHEKGSLEPGKLADLVVLSADPLRVPQDALKEIQVELTMVGGRVVHAAAPIAAEIEPTLAGTL